MHLAKCRCMINTRRLFAAAFTAATAIAMTGCCGGEQHSIRISAPDLLTVQLGNNTLLFYSNTSLTSPPLVPSDLEFVFNTLEGSTGGEGVMISYRGSEAASNQALMLSLALPVALHNGDVYTVGGAFSNVPDEIDANAHGPYDLLDPNKAEVALSESTYTFPPAHFDVNYRATTASGTVRVTNRSSTSVELALDLSFTDAAGRTATLVGRVQAAAERTKASCS